MKLLGNLIPEFDTDTGPKTLFRLEGVGRSLKDSHFKFM